MNPMSRSSVPHMRGPWVALLAMFMLLLTGCQGFYSASPASVDARPGFDDFGPQDKGTALFLDDVTNGLGDNSSVSPLASAFFNDGKDVAFRVRSENYFGQQGKWGKTESTASGSSGQGKERSPEPPEQRKQRMLIYSGHVRVEVARAGDASTEFLAKIEAWGGYLQKQTGTVLTVRVPAVHFDEAFKTVRDYGRVLSESREASDVTEEFVDVRIRVENARRSRERLLEVLKLAKKVEDILRVEKELSRVTQEIERLEGRLKFLRDQVSMSTLRAEFQSVATAPPVKRQRRRSRFGWVNMVGADAVMGGF